MPDALDKDFLVLVYDVARLMRIRADQRARQRGMTRAQWMILAWLERQPGISQQELASLCEVEPITVGRLFDRLETLGLVERRPDARDRRIKRLHLKPEASPILKELHAYRKEASDVLGVGLSTAEIETISRGLMTMKSNLLEEKRENAEAV